MKIIIAYVLLIFGAPVAFSALFGFMFAWLPDLISETIEGITSTILALLMFHCLSVKVTFFVPIILVAITSLWLSQREEYKAILWQSIGITITAIGYFIKPN
ncbi:MAG: hypothetical protein NUV86_12410 [Candidatus Scalindua sp.]|nr:hypothetical protein [Candidatus Brocadiales bacterium]MCR4291049.1 hypothetical protein [Candidatus Scalindua sp.]MCR4343168.1 hypothetical protein [Candidatus Scalindua sp.]